MDRAGYIQNLLEEAGIFADENRGDAIPLIAEACKNNPRSIVRLLNRIRVTTQISSMEKCQYDALSLLVHIATDDARFAGFRDSLELTVVIEQGDKNFREVRDRNTRDSFFSF
jgi:Holliday junction resolvasome RuvABC ATP-dependent DNA helicase subunit